MNRNGFQSANLRGIPLGSALRLLRPGSRSRRTQPRHVFLCLADHYEPYFEAASPRVARDRVAHWRRDYPRSVAGLSDSRGRPPQHTFFYPAEEYDPQILDQLAALAHEGYGDVEVHLHHDQDSSEGFRDKVLAFTECLCERHSLLRRDADGRIRYGFIHGNWALDNARPDGRWCGVNDEISILQQTGCYADFTMPSAPEPGQTRMVNSIYYAVDDPLRPKSHDWGTPARVGESGPADGLLMIQGPLAWNWRRRKWGLLPRLENGDLHGRNVPSWPRFCRWLECGVSVQGRPDWVFIKLHTHGAIDFNTALFLDGAMRQFHEQLAKTAQLGVPWRYYYVTAREMADLVHQAERGQAEPVLPGSHERDSGQMASVDHATPNKVSRN